MEQSIIINMMLTRSNKEIAETLEIELDRVAAFIQSCVKGTEIITRQMKLDAKKTNQSLKKAIEKPIPVNNKKAEEKKLAFEKREQKRANQAERMSLERQRSVLRRQPAYKTIVRDYSAMVMVRVDDKTQIYVKRGEDIQAARERYQIQVAKSKAAYLASDVKPERHKTAKKKCNRCEVEKTPDEFNKSRTCLDGKSGICKLCESKINKLKRADQL